MSESFEPLFKAPRHTHLDQRRRPRGQCPACDLIWAWQDERIDQHRNDEHVEQHGRAIRRTLWESGARRYRKGDP